LAITVGFVDQVWLVLLLLIPTGFSTVYLGQAANQRIQLGVDAAYRGRVMALFVLIFLGTAPIGSMVASFIAEHLGAQAAISIGGAVALAAAICSLTWQLRHSGEKLSFQVRPWPRLKVVQAEGASAA
jgi:predicted MFS family arabinose efflux permease